MSCDAVKGSQISIARRRSYGISASERQESKSRGVRQCVTYRIVIDSVILDISGIFPTYLLVTGSTITQNASDFC